jgi:hypothetical protein
MNKEKIILSFIALLVGLFVAVGGFFLYQKTKAISPNKITKIVATSPSPSPKEESFLKVDSPTDESVVASASVKVSGQTKPDAKILIVTQTTQQSADPTGTGSFSATVGVESGQNIIHIIATMPNGQTFTVKRTVTVSSENF